MAGVRIPEIAADSQATKAKKTSIGITTRKKLDRLAKDFPGIHKRVQIGELSVHRAAVEAGIVKEPTLLEKARKAAARLPRKELAELVAWAQEQLQQG